MSGKWWRMENGKWMVNDKEWHQTRGGMVLAPDILAMGCSAKITDSHSDGHEMHFSLTKLTVTKIWKYEWKCASFCRQIGSLLLLGVNTTNQNCLSWRHTGAEINTLADIRQHPIWNEWNLDSLKHNFQFWQFSAASDPVIQLFHFENGGLRWPPPLTGDKAPSAKICDPKRPFPGDALRSSKALAPTSAPPVLWRPVNM